MSYVVIRDGIEATLAGITDIGRVHDYWRYDSTVKALVDHHKTTIGGVAQIRTWLIEFTGMEPVERPSFGDNTVIYQFTITAYRSLNDDAASEKEFMVLVETAMRALAQKKDFGDDEATLYSTTIAGMRADHAMFAEILCHRARIQLTVEVDSPLNWS